MVPLAENWFVRFPDGRVVRAKSTTAVRYHIESGRIPRNSRVRRHAEEDWQRLEWAPEFADLCQPPAPRDGKPAEESQLTKSGLEFRTIGVRGLVNELFSAVDSSLNRYKLWIAGLTALVWMVGFLAWRLLPPLAQPPWSLLTPLLIGLVMLVAAGIGNALIFQMTFLELSRLRKARWKELRPGLILIALRITTGQVLIVGTLLGVIAFLGHFDEIWEWALPDFVPAQLLTGIAWSLYLFLKVAIWAILGISFLLGPVVVVEECSLRRALATWADMLRQDLSRIFLYETLAVALGAVLTAPLICPVLWVGFTMPSFSSPFLNAVSLATLHVLAGLALTPLIAYLLAANVFIYLNLRYEFYSAPTR